MITSRFSKDQPLGEIGYAMWIRNITIAVVNSPFSQVNLQVLELKKSEFIDNQLVLEQH